MPIDMNNDQEFRRATIKDVRECEGGWTITDTDGWSLFVTDAECSVAPVAGESVRMWGRGIGYEVRGITVEDRVYRYQTNEEARAEFAVSLARMKAKKTSEYEAKRDDYDARVLALPAPLRDRIEAFRERNGDAWRYEFEPYELFVCEQAAAFALALGTSAALEEFRALDFDAQREAVPAMSEGHSGNTLGASVALACALLDTPQTAPKIHGALCPLVGCREYGCFAATAPSQEPTP